MEPTPVRSAWVQVIKGAVNPGGMHLGTGNGAAVSHESSLASRRSEDAKILLFDLS